MLKHLLIPLDGSLLAEAAIEEARRITSMGTLITLLTIVRQPHIAIDGDDLASSWVSTDEVDAVEAATAARNYLEKVAKDLQIDGFEVHMVVECGASPEDMISEIAREVHADAIVMSTHGRSGIRSWAFGSVASKVLSSTCCPVLIVPSRESERLFAEEASEINYG
jgi:nucleotide-binding universal stress UspA family protein